MLKVTKYNRSFIVPVYWMEPGGFLKNRAVHALKVFFGDETKEQALEKTKKAVKRGWKHYEHKEEMKVDESG